MKTKKLAFLISGIIGSLTVAQVQAATDEAVNLDSIQVEGSSLFADKASATKTDTPIIDVPQSLSVVTAEQISLQGINSIGDIIDYTPGVNTSQGEGHRDSVVFRGVRSTADFFVDGVRDDVQYYRSLYNVEQVEVLRGPSALIFGRGVGGGAVNRVIKKAKLGEEFTTYQASLDSFSETSLQLDTNFIFNDNVAGRINFSYESLDNHRDFYEGDRIGINPTLKLKLSSATTVDLGYEYINHNRFIDRGIPTGADGEPVGSFDDIVFGDPDLNETDLIAHVFRADLAHVFSDNLTGNVKFSYGDYDKSYRNFYVSGYDQVNTPNVVTLDGYVDTTERQTLTLTGDLLGKFDFAGVQHKVLLGAEYSQTDSDQDRYNAFWNTTSDDNEIFTVGNRLSLNNGIGINSLGNVTTNSFSTDLNDDTRVELDVTSLYFQDEIAVTDWLDIVVGARYDRFDIEVDNRDPSSSSFGKRSRTDNEISPRAGIIFKPMENVSLYASYSESFLPRSGEQYANINGDNDNLDPDVYENKEFGLKWNINPDLLFTAAYFEIEQETSDLDGTGEQFEEVALEVDGFELQLQGYITDQLSFNAGYTYLDGELADGNDPRELPENKFSLWTNYDYSTKLGFGVGVIYQDESFINTDNTAVLPEYTRVDAAVYYHVSEKLRVQLNVENLFDEEYYPNAHATHQATVGAPINARLTVSGEF